MPATVVNNHVARLGRYLTFEPGHDQIYEERADPDQLKSIETIAARTLKALVAEASTRIIVLTGDAGHGKTHLCRIALESALGWDAKTALGELSEKGEGDRPIARLGQRDLFVVRDLSELRASAVQRLRDAVGLPDRVTIVCANEGKLRAVVSEAREELDIIRTTLEETQRSGRIAVAEGVIVLDLNHQSVTARDEESFLAGLLHQWVLDGRKWSACAKCPAQDHCPILMNRRLLSGEDDPAAGRVRRDGLTLVLRVAEQAGTPITIRETLILMAFAITGGLDCEDVQQRAYGRNREGLRERLYFQTLFNPPLRRDQRATLPLLQTLARLDPGRNAIRTVDEALISSPSEEWSRAETTNAAAKPTTRSQLRTEAKRHRELLASLRRQDFFDLRTDGEWRAMRGEKAPQVPRAERLGFRYHALFESIVDPAARTPESSTSVRDLILKGLEAVQDVRRGGQQTKFAVVDPAYALVSGTASILAKQIPVRRIDVVPQREHWRAVGGGHCRLPKSVDWIDRRVTVVFKVDPEPIAVDLNLIQFEFVLRSAAGLASRRFFQGDIRRITSRLDRLAEGTTNPDETITVIYGDQVLSVLVEEDGRIRCSVGS